MTRTFCDRCGEEAVVEPVAVGYWTAETDPRFSWLPAHAEGFSSAARGFPWGCHRDLCARCTAELLKFMRATRQREGAK